jgi:2-oxoisovalerate dehydrogenase E1 component
VVKRLGGHGHVGFFSFKDRAGRIDLTMDATTKSDSGRTRTIDCETWLTLYKSLATAREIDRVEREYVRRGLAFFHAAGAGHEGSAALAPHLTADDWLHCHYRDKALLFLRGLPIREFFLSLFCKAESHSAGRQMCAHLSARDLNVLSIVGPVGNNALQAAGVAMEIKSHSGRPIVVCSVGDGTAQQGEFFEAIAEAVREQLPVLFLIEDNRWSISTPTPGRTFFSRPDGPASEFYGLPIDRVDGRDPVAAFHAFGAIVATMRKSRRPALVWMQVERLTDHSNADDQTLYRESAEIALAVRDADPVTNMRSRLVEMGVDPAEIRAIDETISSLVTAAAAAAAFGPDPEPVFTAKRPLPTGTGDFAREPCVSGTGPALTMGPALRETLGHHLRTNDRVILFGEDIEDPKGDVFGVTRGLSTEFPGRVLNSPLSESTIVGVSIGRALAGARPVAFLQFADFLPLAFNQIAAELGSISWRTSGAWDAPVIVLISCGGYRPGLGPFHSQTMESLAAHVPGVDVVMPATAGDAAGLLNAAFASGRPTLFFYPKSCLNLSEQATTGDVERHFVPLGAARRVRSGNDLTFASWGYPVFLCEKAAAALSGIGIESDVLDLRSLSPWDETSVRMSAEKTGRLIVVHEDNHTCGFGAEVVATIAETAGRHVDCRRVTRPDTFVPCHFPSQLDVLPSFRRVLSAAAEMLGLDLTWERDPETDAGSFTVDAVGSGPADETILITEILVERGAQVAVGDVVATAEADKSIVEISSNVAGIVDEVFVAAGDAVSVGNPLIRIASRSGSARKAIVQEQCGRPILKRRAGAAPDAKPFFGNGSENGPSAGLPESTPALDQPACGSLIFRDLPISPRQRRLNHRMTQSLHAVPQGTITHSIVWDEVVSATARMRGRHPGLAVSEFDVLAYCAARATADSPGLRSALVGEATRREYTHLNLGIAVHLPGDELVTAVIRRADALAFEDFLATGHAQIRKAHEGNDQATQDTQLLITHLGRLPITNAMPVLISPAAGVLFVGAATGVGATGVMNMTLGFDHRLLNGVAAARYLCGISRQILELGCGAAGSDTGRAAVRSAVTTRGSLRELLQMTPVGDRKLVFHNQIGRIVASLVQCDLTQIDPRQPLRNLGLDSLTATELAEVLGKGLDAGVPATLAWNYPTIETIVDHLLDQLGMRIAESSQSSAGVMSSEALLFEIEQLSDGQVQALLDALPSHP